MSFPLVYEVNTRVWLRECAARAGRPVTLAEVPGDVVREWAAHGFTHVWLMGVWRTGPKARAVALADARARAALTAALPDWRVEDVQGSPYAIAGYQVDEALGGDAGLARFRRQLAAHGLKLLLDFIPNHVGLDHPWLDAWPDYFVRSPVARPETFALPGANPAVWVAHGKDPNFPAWPDTAQLDHRNPALRAALIAELLAVAGRCDGVRADLAMLALNDVFHRTWSAFPSPHAPLEREFWTEAIAAVWRAHPEFLFLGEAYWGLEPALQTLGFDFTYDKTLYDELVLRDPSAVARHLLEDSSPRFVQHSAHFLENHDEPRAAALFYPEEHRAAALLVLGLPGLRLLHEGQLTGACRPAAVQLVRRAAEPPAPEIQAMYDGLLRALRESCVGRGRPLLLRPRAAWPGNGTWRNLLLIQWQARPEQFDLVVVNLVPHRSQCYAPLVVPDLGQHHWALRDLLGTERYLRVGADLEQQGLYLDVPPYAAQLFHFQPAG